MGFHIVKLCFLLFITICQENALHAANSSTQFSFHDVKSCKNTEFYDFDEFRCLACKPKDQNLESQENKLSCKCKAPFKPTVLYDSLSGAPICAEACNTCVDPQCVYKYVNATLHSRNKQLQVTAFNVYTNESDCKTCDLKWNTPYQDYCISKALLQPYAKYSYFWQTNASYFAYGQLKFVAFFCMELRNRTACQQLANLCVLSRHSTDKNSPCHVFLLAQATDTTHFADLEAERLQQLRPFLYYQRGKSTARLLAQPINGSTSAALQFFSTHYQLDGKLRRWGRFQLSHINLCCLHSAACCASQQTSLRCTLTLENLIDYAQLQANDNFISLYLNISQQMLMPLPILIEDLTAEHKRNHTTEWQLVRRFCLIEAKRRSHASPLAPTYEDAHKLSLFQSLRYVERFELHYIVHEDNRLSVPLVRLRYRHIELRSNATLQDVYPFSCTLTFSSSLAAADSAHRLQGFLLPVLMLAAVGAALLHTHNYKQRHAYEWNRDSTYNCSCECLLELLLQLLSQLAHACLLVALLTVSYISARFYTQRGVEITLPLSSTLTESLNTLISVACVLKVSVRTI